MLEFAIEKKQLIYQIQLSGALNNRTCSDFKKFCDDIIEKKYNVIILNFEKLKYISSSGIGGLLYLGKRLKSKLGMGIICCCNEEIKSVLYFLGINSLFQFFDDNEEALKYIKEKFEPGQKQETNEEPALQKKPEKDTELISDSDIKEAQQNIEEPEDNDMAGEVLEKLPEKDIEVEIAGEEDEDVPDAIIVAEDDDPAFPGGTGSSEEKKIQKNFDDEIEESLSEDLKDITDEDDLDFEVDLMNKAKGNETGEAGKADAVIQKDPGNDDFIIINTDKDIKTKQLEEEKFQDFFIECHNCKAFLRIKNYGKHYCPECKKVFEVDENKNYIF